MKEIRFRLGEKEIKSISILHQKQLRKTVYYLEKREKIGDFRVSWIDENIGEWTDTSYPNSEVERLFKEEKWVLIDGTFPEIGLVISYLDGLVANDSVEFDDTSYLDIAKQIKDRWVYDLQWDITDDQLVEFAKLILLIW